MFFFELEAHPSNDALVQIVHPFSLAGAFNAAAFAFASLAGSSRPHGAWQWLFLLIIPPLPLLLHLFYIFWKPLRSELNRAYRLRSGHRVFVVLKVAWALFAPLVVYLVLVHWGGSLSPSKAAGLAAKSTPFLVASLTAHAFAALSFAFILLARPAPYPSSPMAPAASLGAATLGNYDERTPLTTAINSTEGDGSITLLPPPSSATAPVQKKRPKRLPASAVPPDAPLTTRLEALLVSPPEYEIVSELMPLAPPDSLLRALVLFFDSRHQFMRLLKTFLLRDIRAAPSPEALFRDEGPAARLYQTFVALAAPACIVPALSVPFNNFCAWTEAMHARGAAPSSDLSVLASHANNIALAFVSALDALPRYYLLIRVSVCLYESTQTVLQCHS